MKTKLNPLRKLRAFFDTSGWFLVAAVCLAGAIGGIVDRCLVHNTQANIPQPTNQMQLHFANWHMSLPK